MLISLHESLLDVAKNPSGEALDAFKHIATARSETKHLVIGDDLVLAELSRCTKLSENDRNNYRHLIGKMGSLGGLRDSMDICIEIFPEAKTPQRAGNVLRVPLSRFAKSDHLREVQLLGENLSDAELYKMLGEMYCLREPSWIVHCEPQNGGGSTTHRVYAQNMQKNLITLCILDSDHKHPRARLGSTASKVEKEKKEEDLANVHILTVRELENLIPNLLTEAILENEDSDPERKRAAAYLQEGAQGHLKSVFPYLDLKEGLHSLPNEPFWQTHQASLETHAYHKKDCPRKDCGCPLVPGLGDKCLAGAIDFLEHKTPRKRAELFASWFEGELETIGRLVSHWCCASAPFQYWAEDGEQ